MLVGKEKENINVILKLFGEIDCNKYCNIFQKSIF